MKNNRAKKINDTIGVEIWNTKQGPDLILNEFTKKTILNLMIDDLVCPDRLVPTLRLRQLSKEIGG